MTQRSGYLLIDCVRKQMFLFSGLKILLAIVIIICNMLQSVVPAPGDIVCELSIIVSAGIIGIFSLKTSFGLRTELSLLEMIIENQQLISSTIKKKEDNEQ